MTELKFLSFDLILMILDSYHFGFNSQTMNIRMETTKAKKKKKLNSLKVHIITVCDFPGGASGIEPIYQCKECKR